MDASYSTRTNDIYFNCELTKSCAACVTSATRCSGEWRPPARTASGSRRAASQRRHCSTSSQFGVRKLSNEICVGNPNARIASLKSDPKLQSAFRLTLCQHTYSFY